MEAYAVIKSGWEEIEISGNIYLDKSKCFKELEEKIKEEHEALEDLYDVVPDKYLYYVNDNYSFKNNNYTIYIGIFNLIK